MALRSDGHVALSGPIADTLRKWDLERDEPIRRLEEKDLFT